MKFSTKEGVYGDSYPFQHLNTPECQETARTSSMSRLSMYGPLMFKGIQYMNNSKPNKRSRKGSKANQGGPPQKKRSLNAPKSERVYAPVAQGLIRKQGKPIMRPLGARGSGDTFIAHTEYFGDVAGSVAFAATRYAINPGRSALFPWLSTVARRFESYRFRKLRFHFESQAPTTATGTAILGIDYDAADASPADKVSVMSYKNSCRCSPWESMVHSSDSEDLHKLKSNFVRGDVSLAANLDVKTYDIGNLFICTQGQANTNAIGEGYVEYEIELLTPQLSPTDVPSAKIVGTTGIASAVPFGTDAALAAGSNIDVSVNAAGTTITFNQAFEGLALWSIVGGTSKNTFLVGAGSATVSLVNATTASTTDPSCQQYLVRASIGQTFAPTCNIAGVPTNSQLRLCAYSSALA